MEKYRDWEILEALPKDWQIDTTAGSPAPNTVFITNGKSPLKGQKRALLKVERKQEIVVEKIKPLIGLQKIHIADLPKEENYIFPSKTANDLARLKFKEQLLKEIMFDLMVCEVEGWDKKQYINELKNLLNGINNKPKKATEKSQNDLFSCVNT
jgi:hypothetical protein